MVFKIPLGGVLSSNLTPIFISYMVAEKSIFENLRYLEFWVIFYIFFLTPYLLFEEGFII